MDYRSFAFIMTAVEVETAAIKHCFDDWRRINISGDEQSYYETEFNRDSTKLRILTVQQNVMGMTAATLLAAKAVERFRPRYLIMSGIAAGADETASQIYGDVLVPNMVWDYSTGKYVGPDEAEIRFGDVGFLPRPVSIATDEDIVEIIKGTIDMPDNECHVHIGPLACGSIVIANSRIMDKQIRSLFPHTVGLDMESYSVYYVAKNISEPRPTPIVVKSICDFANESKDDKYQKFASFTSAQYVRYLLETKLPVHDNSAIK